MSRTLILAIAVVNCLSASAVNANHRGRTSVGIGIGGGGIGISVGRGYSGRGFYGPGYGWGGNYGPGYYGGYYGSGLFGPSYYGPGYYSSPNYYYAPAPVYSAPAVIRPIAPSAPQPPAYDAGPIVLTNPATNDKPIEYSLSGTRFSMKPGQSQKFAHDRNWIIEFDRGDSQGLARYQLKSAAYKFKPTANGWELFESADSLPTTGANHGRSTSIVVPPPPGADEPSAPADKSGSAPAGTDETVVPRKPGSGLRLPELKEP